MVVLNGKGVSPGIVIGRLSYFQHGRKPLARRPADNVKLELEHFEKARQAADEQLVALYEHALSEVDRADAQIFQIHRMMLKDSDFCDSVQTIIRMEKVVAQYAVEKASERYVNMFLSMDNVYMQERAADMKDVADRLIAILSGEAAPKVSTDSPVIVAAEDLAPSETILLDRNRILAFVTKRGSGTSHTAILASTMSIPAVVGVGESIGPMYDGKQAAVDGTRGKVYIEPDGETLRKLRRRRDREMQEQGELQKLKGLPSVTRDGRKISILANIAGTQDVETALQCDAEGVGLFRTEFLYLERSGCPSQEEQFDIYKAVIERMAGKRVVIRTLDIGADKRADYLNMPYEENPALGCRGIRLCLKRPELFRTQLRAILRASAFGEAAILLPMVSSVEEVRKAKAYIDEVRGELKTTKIPYNKDTKLGVMIETPAAALISDRLALEADFFSIGTNDLTQYTLAVDRQNASSGLPFDDYHPAVLRLIELTAHNARQRGIPVCVCGELAGDPRMTETFVSYGITELSVSPARVLALRHTVRSLPSHKRLDG